MGWICTLSHCQKTRSNSHPRVIPQASEALSCPKYPNLHIVASSRDTIKQSPIGDSTSIWSTHLPRTPKLAHCSTIKRHYQRVTHHQETLWVTHGWFHKHLKHSPAQNIWTCRPWLQRRLHSNQHCQRPWRGHYPPTPATPFSQWRPTAARGSENAVECWHHHRMATAKLLLQIRSNMDRDWDQYHSDIHQLAFFFFFNDAQKLPNVFPNGTSSQMVQQSKMA